MKRNILYQWSYQILTLIIPFVTVPYISRLLGAGGIGIYSYHYSIVNYFMLFAMLGINTYGNRSIAKARDNKTWINSTFSEILCVQIISSSIMTILYIVYICMYSTNKNIAAIQLIYMIGCMCDINWFYFGIEAFKVTVMRNFVVKIVTVISIFTFVRSCSDIYTYTVIMAIGTVISQSIMWMQLPKYAQLVKVQIGVAIKKHAVGILILFIPTIATSVYKIMDKLMLGNMVGMLEVGYYENSEKIITIINSFILSVGTVMLPQISNMVVSGKRKEIKRYTDSTMEICIMISVALAFGLVAISDEFVILFLGSGFEKCVRLIKILAVTLVFTACSNVIRTQYLIPYDKDRELSLSLILGAVINIIINLILIPKYYAVGAAIGTMAAEIIVCVVQFYYMSKQYKVFHYIKNLIFYMVKGTIMYCILIFVPYTYNRLVTMGLKIIIGIMVYGALTFGVYRIKKVTDTF